MTGGLHDCDEVHASLSPVRDTGVSEVVKPEVLDLGLPAGLIVPPSDVRDRLPISGEHQFRMVHAAG